MKKKITSLLVSIVIALGLFPAMSFAANGGTCGGNLTWTLSDDGTLTISGTGEMENYDFHNVDRSPAPWDNTKIKNIIIEDGVTSIGAEAFFACYDLTSVTIPGSVTSVGMWAFNICPSLENVYITNLESWCNINFVDSSLGGSLYINGTLATHIDIPDTITSIRDRLFLDCKNLKSVTIHNGVTNIGSSAFSGCDSLESVTIPSSVTSIGSSAFSGCDSLESVTIPNTVTSIGSSAFSGCDSLVSVTIPNSVTSIEKSAFDSCDKLTDVVISGGVKSIGDSAFHNCKNLSSVTIEDGVEKIDIGAFRYCNNIKSLIIPESVTKISGGAFTTCDNLKEVTVLGYKIDIEENAITPRVTICGYAGSDAEMYAAQNGNVFINIEDSDASDQHAIKVKLNGKKIKFDVQPQIINERTMVPVRAIFEALGASVEWDQATQTVTSKKGDTTISLAIDNPVMMVNDEQVTLDQSACIIDERTLVPVRAISEAFGTTVGWDQTTKTVSITTSDYVAPPVVYYDDISANVNQINDMINRGLYVEAIQECDQTKAWHNLSPADIRLLDSLKNTAQSKYNAYLESAKKASVETYALQGLRAYISSMKNPASAKLYSIYAGYYERSKYNDSQRGEAFAVVLDIAGQNSYGGTTRSDVTIFINPSTGQMILDLEEYGKRQERDGYGMSSIKGIEIQNEALYLQLYRATALTKFDANSMLKRAR